MTCHVLGTLSRFYIQMEGWKHHNLAGLVSNLSPFLSKTFSLSFFFKCHTVFEVLSATPPSICTAMHYGKSASNVEKYTSIFKLLSIIHYEILPMQFSDFFQQKIFLIFAQNIDCGYTLARRF